MMADATDFNHLGPEVVDAMVERDDKLADLQKQLAETKAELEEAEARQTQRETVRAQYEAAQEGSLERPAGNVITQAAAGRSDEAKATEAESESEGSSSEPSGSQGFDPADISERIVAAENDGDWQTAMALKLQLSNIRVG